jgi:hypothetical protein
LSFLSAPDQRGVSLADNPDAVAAVPMLEAWRHIMARVHCGIVGHRKFGEATKHP